MKEFKVKIEENGRVVIPSKIRKHLNLQGGDILIGRVEGPGISLAPRKASFHKVHAALKEYTQGAPTLSDLLFEVRQEESYE